MDYNQEIYFQFTFFETVSLTNRGSRNFFVIIFQIQIFLLVKYACEVIIKKHANKRKHTILAGWKPYIEVPNKASRGELPTHTLH